MTGHGIYFVKPETVELRPFSVKDPGPAEAQVKITHTLISAGTEKAHLFGGKNTGHRFPVNAGYSSVGYVTATGSKVKSVQVGDRVFVGYGGHANYATKETVQIQKIPEGVSMEEAVFTRVASFPLAAVRRSRLELGESCVVVGLGMLGLFAVQLARAAGAYPIIAIGNREIRQEKAREYGADYVFSPDEPDLTKKIFAITETLTSIRGANVVIETSGSESGLLKCLEYTAKRARVMLNGCNREMTSPVDFYQYVHLRGVEIIGVHGMTRLPHNSAPGNWTAKRDNLTILNFFKTRKISAKEMLSEIHDPIECREVYQRLLYDRQFPLGVLFDWEHFVPETE